MASWSRTALASQPQYYYVEVGAQLDERWMEYLPVVRSTTHTAPISGATSLVLHVVDQAELMGIINSLHGLGLSLLIVKRLANFHPDN